MSQDAVLINSIIGDGVKIGVQTVIINCHLEAPLTVGDKCIVSGIQDGDITVSKTFILTVTLYNVNSLDFGAIKSLHGQFHFSLPLISTIAQ